VCGEAIDVRQATAYMEVDEYQLAERIVAQLEEYLHRNKKKDFTPDEIRELREQYAQWIRTKA